METDSDTDWDLNWADTHWIREYFDQMHFEEHQRLNHFRNHYELTRKDLLVKNLKRLRRHLERNECPDDAAKFAFFPATFTLPSEYGIFVEEFKRNPGSTWIMKPIGKSQGKGIFLFNKLSMISEWKKDHKWKADSPQAESYIAQRYIDRPLLIGGKKFDMRLYVLVTSFSPLQAWQYREGFCRFSNQPYRSPSALEDGGDKYIHLTNHSVQKHHTSFQKDDDFKWDLRSLRMYMKAEYGADLVEQAFYELTMVMIRSLLAVQKIIIQDRHCFELYGFDLMFDAELKPWLIEVNASPSLTASAEKDYNLKFGMLEDAMTIIDMEAKLSGDEERVGGFDLVWDGGYVFNEREKNLRKNSNSKVGRMQENLDLGPTFGYSYLGCYKDDRAQHLEALHKKFLKRNEG
eukprot:g2308.t1